MLSGTFPVTISRLFPEGYSLDFDATPSAEVRATMAREINGFHSRTVPHESNRFAWLVRNPSADIVAGLIGVISWEWLFIEAIWVGDALRGQGMGRLLMSRAEAHAVAAGCHSAWLDTFQAQDFYLRLGYEVFGILDNYPKSQTRSFLRKRLEFAAP
jgi:ribosomal protein S18 acetylase RimI-like enzyme